MDEVPTKTSAGKLNSPQYVVELLPSDVLLGRGPGIDHFLGNIEFRNVVNQWKRAYQAATRGTGCKDEIADMILAKIVSKNGRFLRRVTNSIEANELGIPPNVCAWVKIDARAAMEKTEQAFLENGDFGLGRRRAVDAKKKSDKGDDTTPQQPSNINASFPAPPIPSAYHPTSSLLPVSQPQLQFERALPLMHRPAELRSQQPADKLTATEASTADTTMMPMDAMLLSRHFPLGLSQARQE